MLNDFKVICPVTEDDLIVALQASMALDLSHLLTKSSKHRMSATAGHRMAADCSCQCCGQQSPDQCCVVQICLVLLVQ